MGICLTRETFKTTTTRSNSSRRRSVMDAIAVFGEGEGEFMRIESGTKVQTVLENFPNHLICNSKSFAIGKIIREMGVDEEVNGGKIYFLMPRLRSSSVFKKSDMASLLAKANYAVLSLTKFSPKREEGGRPCDANLASNEVPLLAVSRQFTSPSKFIKRPAKWSSKLAPITEVETC